MTVAQEVPGHRIGPDGIPARTLGWQILQWTADFLEQPDGDHAGESLNLTNEQARFLLWWYALDDQGRFINRYGMLRRMKGWGKDPLAAIIACVEFVGPCRFGGWDKNGNPIAVPHYSAWVQVAAVSKDQTRNTMTLFPGMLSKGAIAEYGIDLGKEIIYAHRGRCRIEAVTSSPRALEGGRATFVVKNESHHWLASNEGLAMADVIARNAAKSRDGSSRALAISNAHAPSEGSDAQRDWEAFSKDSSGFLYDSVEASQQVEQAVRRLKAGVEEEGDIDLARAGLEYCRGDSDWLHIPRLMEEVLDPRTPVNTGLRFYFNIIAASEERAFDIAQWDALAQPESVPDGTLITLGFDGSRVRDHTALIGTVVASGYQWVLGYWEPEIHAASGERRIPIAQVLATVEDVFARYQVWRLYADPWKWRSELAEWAGRYGEDRVVEFRTDRFQRMAPALHAYDNAIRMGEIAHSGDRRLKTNIENAHKKLLHFRDDDGEPMWVIEKDRPDSPFKIDAAVAGCLSWAARLDAVAAGAGTATSAQFEVFAI